MTYDLWDIDTGNNLGHFTGEEDAFRVVRSLLDAYGDAYAEELQLGGSDDAGRVVPPLSGSALAERARQPASALRG